MDTGMNTMMNGIGSRRIGAGAMRGITLIELMIVIVIIGILAAIGYPSYSDYITKSRRAAAVGNLIKIADRQETFFANNKRYATNFTELGYATNTIGLDRDGQTVEPTDTERTYTMSITNTIDAGTQYSIQVVPVGVQATKDAKCATISINQLAVRASTGTTTDANECF